jgi:hypothetical protein
MTNINFLENKYFYNFKFICPINYFLFNNSILDKGVIYKNRIEFLMGDVLTTISGEIVNYDSKKHFEQSNKFINVIKKDNYYYNINYFNKFLIGALQSINILGIVDYNDILKKINPIMINLNENNIKHLWGEINDININFFENIESIEEINNKLSLFLKEKDEYLNFIFLKSDIPFYFIINERELDNDYNIISNNDIITNYNIHILLYNIFYLKNYFYRKI